MKKGIQFSVVLLLMVFGVVSCDLLQSIIGGGVIDLEAGTVIVTNDGDITFEVENLGAESITDILVWILYSPDTTIDKNDTQVASAFVTVGAGLATLTTISADTLDLSGLSEGDYYVGIYVDPESEIVEENETNNT